MFSRLWQFIRQVIHRMFPFKDVAAVEHIDTPLSNEMIDALDLWYKMYTDSPPLLSPGKVKSLNLPSLICSEVARQVLLEVKWNISGKADENGNAQDSPRAEYLKAEFGKLMQSLRSKLEQACAAGGMTIKPYPKDGHIYFDCATAWSLYPIAFDDDGNLKDVIFRDSYQDGTTTYTRLERHTVTDKGISITQRAFRSNNRESIGVEIPLTDVPQWAEAEPEALLTDTEGQMFGWFKTANANNVDIDAPMGVAVFNKAVNIIREADMQYSRILWEYEGSELAIDVDPTVLRQQMNGRGRQEMPQLNERLFRGVDLGDDHYQVFSPAIRDSALFNGLNQLFMRVEDSCGLARGTLSDANQEARTATELRIVKQRTYATIADNQRALEHCLRDVVRAMDKYATMYDLAPAGDYDLSFEWDDSIITDASQQLGERLELMSQGLMSKTEFRMWYFGETEAQAERALQKVQQEQLSQSMDALLTAQSGATGASAPDDGE